MEEIVKIRKPVYCNNCQFMRLNINRKWFCALNKKQLEFINGNLIANCMAEVKKEVE